MGDEHPAEQDFPLQFTWRLLYHTNLRLSAIFRDSSITSGWLDDSAVYSARYVHGPIGAEARRLPELGEFL